MQAKTIIARALANATGKTEAEVTAALSAMAVQVPDKDIADDEAERLLRGLSAEAAGMFAWLVEGARRFYAERGVFDPRRN
jgi:hypothetical protein